MSGFGFNMAGLWARLENARARWLPIGGPATLDGMIALRVAPTATDASSEQQPFLAIEDNANGADPQTLLGVAARLQGFDGDLFHALRTMSPSVADQTDDAPGILVTAKKTERSATDTPAAAVAATLTASGAGAGTRNITTAICVTLACDAAAAAPIVVTLTDSNDGVLWSAALAAPANGTAVVSLTGLSIVGSDNGDQTLAFAAAGPAGSRQTVSMTGYVTAA